MIIKLPVYRTIVNAEFLEDDREINSDELVGDVTIHVYIVVDGDTVTFAAEPREAHIRGNVSFYVGSEGDDVEVRYYNKTIDVSGYKVRGRVPLNIKSSAQGLDLDYEELELC